jgi:tetratricopeptide (TPR) repeat protein
MTEEQQALRIYVRFGHRRGQAGALHGIAMCETRFGRRAAAIRHFGDALAISWGVADATSEADCWLGLGDLYRRESENGRAAGCLGRAVELYRTAGNRAGAAAALLSLGHARLDEGRAEQARAAWTESLRIYEEARSPTADDLRERLEKLDAAAPATAIPPIFHEFGTRHP